MDLAAPGRLAGGRPLLRRPRFAVAGAAAVAGALWTLDPAWTFLVAAFLGLLGTAWAVCFSPAPAPLPICESCHDDVSPANASM